MKYFSFVRFYISLESFKSFDIILGVTKSHYLEVGILDDGLCLRTISPLLYSPRVFIEFYFFGQFLQLQEEHSQY